MRRRIIPAAAVASALAISALTGCSSASSGERAECVTPLAPGALSNGVTVGSGGDVEITGPSEILNAQRTLIEGRAAEASSEPGGIAIANLSIYDAASGELIQAQEDAPFVVLPEDLIGEAEAALNSADSASVPLQYLLAASLLCTAPGDTVVVGATADQSVASQISTASTVTVLEIEQVFDALPSGRTQGLPSGFPAVAVDASGRPGIVLPPQAAPSETRVASRVVGTGDELGAEQTAIGNVLTVSWDGNVVTNTWESGMVVFGSESDPNTTYTFRDELTGIPLGSQVVILDPNDGDPVVHVIDLVAAI